MTFVFGLVLGALIGGLYLADRNATRQEAVLSSTSDIAALQNELQVRAGEIAGLHESLEAADRELQQIVESMTIAGPAEVEAALQVADARQLEIDSLSAELASVRSEIESLRAVAETPGNLVQYAFVLETMHAYAQAGYVDGSIYGEDPALDDALTEVGDDELARSVIVGLLESDAAETTLFYEALQAILNHMQTHMVG